jgi:glutamate racemase
MLNAAAPIGVFDSGVGGLTVLRALRTELPHESFIYLGDTARLPYGTKSPETVVRYAQQAAEALVARGIKALVVACNTASATALPALQLRFDDLPVIGVVEPGARAAVAASRSGRIAVLATEGTVRGGAYQQSILTLRPEAQVQAVACQLFVALAEEGWVDGEVAEAAARRYLEPLLSAPPDQRPDVIVLGCTHFPVLRPVITALAGNAVQIVDSAATTARCVSELLQQRGLLNTSSAPGEVRFLATDGLLRFTTVGVRFLGTAISAADVELIDL